MDPSPETSATAPAAAAITVGPPAGKGHAETIVSTAPVAAPTAAAPNTVIGAYRLVRMIGRGGMGAVWEALDQRLDRRVALKLLLGVYPPGAPQIERFRREALHAAKLRHPNIVPVHDVGCDEGRHYLVMDLVEGDTLGDTLHDRPLSYRQKAVLIEKVARAVQFAHEQGVVHRDLKPANIMIERLPAPTRAVRQPGSGPGRAGRAISEQADPTLGEPRVMDFGLAKDLSDDSSLSQAGHAMGTPSYMPPEQAEGRLADIGERSDVYSLGAILYEALTGRPPFIGETPVQIMHAVVEHEPLAPRRIAADVPRDLETICLKCLEKSPARRYAAAQALADDLAAWLAGEPIAARPAGWFELLGKRMRRNPAAWASGAVAIGLLLVSIAGVIAFLDLRRAEAVRHADALRASLADIRAEQARRERAEADRQRLERERSREWQLVFADDFSDPDYAARWQVIHPNGTVGVVDGALRLRDGTPQIALLRQAVSGDVRVEFTCRQDGRILSDASCFFGAPPLDERTCAPHGYMFQFGGRGNTLTRLLRDQEEIWKVDGPALASGQTYRIAAERVGERLTVRVDDRVVCEVVDPRPLPDDDRGLIGIYGWGADTRIDDVRVYRLGESRSADVLEVVERRLRRGEVVDGEDLLDDVATSASDPQRRERARQAKAELARVRETRRRLSDATATILAAWPDARVQRTDDGLSVELPTGVATDLAPLRGLPVVSLSCSSNPIGDLEALRGLPLRVLLVTDTGITSLEPLAGMRLEALRASLNRVSDLTPLRGMPLDILYLNETDVTDLAPLRGMPLTRLNIAGTRVSDLSPIAQAPLRIFSCGGCPIASLAPIAGNAMTVLRINDLGLGDLEPLRGMRLEQLECSGNAIRSLEPLRGMPLTRLGCGRNAISDLDPLRGMPLASLDLTDNRVADLAPLRDLQLDDLDVSSNAIEDLVQLAGLPLHRLACDGNRIASLAPLRGMRLVELDCAGNAITSLEPLRGMTSLVRLWCGDNPLADLSPLAGLRLELLASCGDPVVTLAPIADQVPAIWLFDADRLPRGEVDEAAVAWSARHGPPDARPAPATPSFGVPPAPPALCSACAPALRGSATPAAGRRYRRVPGSWNARQAGIVARALGGRLAAAPDSTAAAAVLTDLGMGMTVWVAPASGASAPAPARCWSPRIGTTEPQYVAGAALVLEWDDEQVE